MAEQQVYAKGELVPATGRYRCTGSGEVWEATETSVRFPPCETCKDSSCRWVPADAGGAPGTGQRSPASS